MATKVGPAKYKVGIILTNGKFHAATKFVSLIIDAFSILVIYCH